MIEMEYVTDRYDIVTDRSKRSTVLINTVLDLEWHDQPDLRPRSSWSRRNVLSIGTIYVPDRYDRWSWLISMICVPDRHDLRYWSTWSSIRGKRGRPMTNRLELYSDRRVRVTKDWLLRDKGRSFRYGIWMYDICWKVGRWILSGFGLLVSLGYYT